MIVETEMPLDVAEKLREMEKTAGGGQARNTRRWMLQQY